MDTLKVKITGTRPLLMHAATLSDPLNPLSKAHKQVSGKRKKTDEDYEWLAKSEWRSSLYIDDTGPYMPGVNIEAALIAGAKLQKLGTAIKRGVEILNDRCKLEYKGPRDAEALWDKGHYDVRGVKVGQARIMRYRPIFKEWSCECSIMFDTEIMDRASVLKCMQDAGAYCGVGDYRPKFGRFDVEVVK